MLIYYYRVGGDVAAEISLAVGGDVVVTGVRDGINPVVVRSEYGVTLELGEAK